MSNSALQTTLPQRAAPRRRALIALGRRYALAAAVGLALLAGAEWLLPAFGVPAYLLPPPSRVLAHLLDPASGLGPHLSATAAAALLGLAGGALIGAALAVAFAQARPIEDALYPWVLVSQALPAAALAPLLTIWLGNGLAPRAAMAALFALFPVLVSLSRGLRQASPEQLALLRAWGATPWQTFRYLRLPAALPALFSGLRVAAALAVAGAIVGELAGAGRGLGYLITVAAYRLQTERLFAAVALAAALSLALSLALAALERRVVFWADPES